MKRSIKLRDTLLEAESREYLNSTDYQLLKKLEKLLPKDDSLVIAREKNRETIRRVKISKDKT